MRKQSISRVNLYSWITTIVLISAAFIAFFIYEKVNDFLKSDKRLEKSYQTYCHNILKMENLSVVKYISFAAGELKEMKSDDARKKVLGNLKKLKFGAGKARDNVFIFDLRGNALLSPEKRGGKPSEKLGKIVSNTRSGFHTRIVNNARGVPEQVMLYSENYRPWNWIIVTEARESSIRKEYAENRLRLKIDLIIELVVIGILSAAMMLAAIYLSFQVSKSIKKEIDALVDYFAETAEGDAELDLDKLHFREFSFIGKSAVAMVGKIKDLMGQIRELAMRVEMRSQEKSAFLAEMSHEFRGPLNGVLGMSQILLDTDLTKEQQEYIEAIVQSGQTLNSMVANIGDFADIEVGEIETVNKEFDLSAHLSGVIELLGNRASRKNLNLELKIEKKTPHNLYGDVEKIRQIITTLIRNAIFFTEKGSISLEVKCLEQLEPGKGKFLFKVADTGVGISKDRLVSIFNFPPKGRDAMLKFGHISLGLAVCRKIARGMGGSLGAESEKDKGSTFNLILPLEIHEKAEAPPTPEELAKKPFKLEREFTALLAEDDPVNKAVAVKFLSRMGFNVEAVNNGLEAVGKWKEGKFDIIFMDCEMPRMDGFAATREIRKLEEDGKHIPIIAMTAYAMRVDREHCFEAGMDDHISKPVTTQAIQSATKKFLHKQEE